VVSCRFGSPCHIKKMYSVHDNLGYTRKKKQMTCLLRWFFCSSHHPSTIGKHQASIHQLAPTNLVQRAAPPWSEKKKNQLSSGLRGDLDEPRRDVLNGSGGTRKKWKARGSLAGESNLVQTGIHDYCLLGAPKRKGGWAHGRQCCFSTCSL
jgi:hypothetical protein